MAEIAPMLESDTHGSLPYQPSLRSLGAPRGQECLSRYKTCCSWQQLAKVRVSATAVYSMSTPPRPRGRTDRPPRRDGVVLGDRAETGGGSGCGPKKKYPWDESCSHAPIEQCAD